MSEYTDLAQTLIDQADTVLRIELNVAESSLRRGIKTSMKELNEVRCILDLPEYEGTITIKKVKELVDVYDVCYVTAEVKPKTRFTILGSTPINNNPEDY